MLGYATAYTSEQDVAAAVYAAATDGRDQLRYPAVADSAMLAELRRPLLEQEFIARIRAMRGGSATAPETKRMPSATHDSRPRDFHHPQVPRRSRLPLSGC